MNFLLKLDIGIFHRHILIHELGITEKPNQDQDNWKLKCLTNYNSKHGSKYSTSIQKCATLRNSKGCKVRPVQKASNPNQATTNAIQYTYVLALQRVRPWQQFP
jgi:hypothetical protein